MKATLYFTLILLTWTMLAFLPNSLSAEVERPIVRVIYFIPNDLKPQPGINERIDAQVKRVQTLFADLMEAHGFGRKTFVFEEKAGKVVVHHRQGTRNERHYRNDYSYAVWNEFPIASDPKKDYYLVFLAIDTKSEDSSVCGLGYGFSGLTYKGGLIAASRGCGFGEWAINAISHELAHGFGLVHDNRSDSIAQRRYISVIDEMSASYCAAAWFDNHPVFNEGTIQRNNNTKVRMLEPELASSPNTIRLRFEITDPDGIQIVKLISPHSSGDYKLRDCKELNNATDTTVEFITNQLPPYTNSIILRMLDGSGNYIERIFTLTDPLPFAQRGVISHQVVFSELMFESGAGVSGLPRWIEVYNNSNSTVNLRGWKLEWKWLEYLFSDASVTVTSLLDATATFDEAFHIPPKQARLIVTALGRYPPGANFFDDSFYQLSSLQSEGSGQDDIANRFISRGGFSLELTDPENELVDHIGTLKANKQTWELPECLIDDVRSSLIRLFDNGVPRSGIEKDAWYRAYDAKRLVSDFYYGSPSDLGTPWYRLGKTILVDLSQFSATPTNPTQPDLSTYKVFFSEFMFEVSGEEAALPQWFEVYNNGNAAVNLRGWKLQWKNPLPSLIEETATFDVDFRIPPQQSRLIVIALGRYSGVNLSKDAVYQLSGSLKSIISLFPFKDRTLGGFSLKLINPDDEVMDEIGTLSGDKKTWHLPECLVEGYRSSLIRRFDKNVPRSGLLRRGWFPAHKGKRLVAGIYYGSSRDFSTPGYRRGKPLPVELSRFSAKFVKDEVIINWTTESELDNAGFNIYRSTSQTKDFQRINSKLIQGAGTSGERNTYQFIDKSAKPNVAYYYRIEDVDFSGMRGILKTYQLRGVFAPAGKHISTWGTLKNNR